MEDRDTILELTAKIQELQNEINCMNHSREFQDAESVRSEHSHVASQPVSFPPHPVPDGMLSRSLGMPSRKDGPPSIWDAHVISGKRFCKSSRVSFSTLSAGIESGVLIYHNQFTHPQWRKVKGEHQFKIRDASLDRQPKIQSSSVEETLQRIMGQTNNDCRFWILILTNSPRQQHFFVGR